MAGLAFRPLVFVSKRWRATALLASLAAGTAIGTLDLARPIDDMAAGAAFALRRHPASGNLHIVEIDARSIAAIDRWPWPRGNYANLVDKLHHAGAAAIVFDVDLSSRSQPAADRTFAAALARAQGDVVLPTLHQDAGANQGVSLDSLPTPVLRAHSIAAAVSIRPERDGLVRSAPLGIVTAGVPRPSLSAILSGRGGTAGREFQIDYGIDPDTIPRHSFIDIVRGRFDPHEIAGKEILIGATAVELGDRYAVPAHGVVPGVVIQAIAAETLMRGLPVPLGWWAPLLLALLWAAALTRAASRRALAIAVATGPALQFALLVAAQAEGVVVEIGPALGATALAAAIAIARRVYWSLHRRRTRDESTGLGNRHALLEALVEQPAAAIVAARIAEYDRIAAALGDRAVAELVRRVSDRIAAVCDGATIYRIEDRVLAWRAGDITGQVDVLAERLRAVMLEPIEVAGRRIDVKLSLGCADAMAEAPTDAIANATLAADQALTSGAAWHRHTASESDAIERDLSLLSELNDAIAQGGIEVVYQPKLDIAANRIASVEALVRWRHLRLGYLSPELFIPLAERMDHIEALTLCVLRQTIAAVAGWRADGIALSAAVNISAKLIGDDRFTAQVDALIEETHTDPRTLIFEVTESAAMLHPDTAIAALARFKAMGIRISMDDYGTGQSTLSYLKRLPLDELKIDRSFVQFAHQNRSDGALVRSTVDLAHELGLRVVAEGIEDQGCLAFLASIGCDYAQGYLISKPISAQQIATLCLAEREAENLPRKTA